QPTVEASSSGFLAPRASAQAPIAGIVRITSRLDRASAPVQASVAQGALPAIAPTKYALNTAVSTTVVNPEFAKSYIDHAKTSRGATPGFSASRSKIAMPAAAPGTASA